MGLIGRRIKNFKTGTLVCFALKFRLRWTNRGISYW